MRNVFLIMVFVTIILSFTAAQTTPTKDETQADQHSYQFADVSRNIYKEIPEQISITYFRSDKLKSVDHVYQEIEDILREYAAWANGKILLSVYDPVRDKKTQEAQEYGILDFHIGTRDSPDEANIFIAYSGIVIRYLDRFRVVPLIQSTDTLE
ncbi:MAG: Gldg family protein, partial [Deltaproteobacteria bacterium]|nr:Gldg family protein [Deltaproteobacteria bacterium]